MQASITIGMLDFILKTESKTLDNKDTGRGIERLHIYAGTRH